MEKPDAIGAIARVFGGEPIAEDGTVVGYIVEMHVGETTQGPVYRETFPFCGSIEKTLVELTAVLSRNTLLGGGFAPGLRATVSLTPTRVAVDSSRSTPDGSSHG